MPDFVAFYAVIIVMFPMGYFLFASVSFLFVDLGVPEVTRLLRGLFNAYFLMVAVTAFVAVLAFAATGRIVFAVGMCLLGAFSIVARRWFLQRMDAQQSAWEAGNPNSVRQFRALHLGGMAANVLQLGVIMASVPFVV